MHVLFTELFLNNTMKDTDFCTMCYQHFDKSCYCNAGLTHYRTCSETVLLYYIDFCTAIVQETDRESAVLCTAA